MGVLPKRDKKAAHTAIDWVRQKIDSDQLQPLREQGITITNPFIPKKCDGSCEAIDTPKLRETRQKVEIKGGETKYGLEITAIENPEQPANITVKVTSGFPAGLVGWYIYGVTDSSAAWSTKLKCQAAIQNG